MQIVLHPVMDFLEQQFFLVVRTLKLVFSRLSQGDVPGRDTTILAAVKFKIIHRDIDRDLYAVFCPVAGLDETDPTFGTDPIFRL